MPTHVLIPRAGLPRTGMAIAGCGRAAGPDRPALIEAPRKVRGKGGVSLRLAIASCGLLALMVIGQPPRATAASAAEKRAFELAKKFLSDTFYNRAETEFAAFVSKYPDSDLLQEAIFRQAQARFFQTNYAGTAELLTSRLSFAGPLADDYLFLRGDAEFKQARYAAAADTFARLVKEYPNSASRLEAGIKQAEVVAAMKDWPRVIELLKQPDGVFQTAIQTNTANEFTFRGYLLLGEAQLARGLFGAAANTLQSLAGRLLGPMDAWQWQYLMCRIHSASGHLAEALDGTENLSVRATMTGQPGLVAETISFKAQLLEAMERPEEAITTYAGNLTEATPEERQREGLLKISTLCIA